MANPFLEALATSPSAGTLGMFNPRPIPELTQAPQDQVTPELPAIRAGASPALQAPAAPMDTLGDMQTGVFGAPIATPSGLTSPEATPTITAPQLAANVPQSPMAQIDPATMTAAPQPPSGGLAAFGGRTLNQYLTDPTVEGAGLMTDPQGRMIPSGFATRAEAYPAYEAEAAAREQRLADAQAGRAAGGEPRTYGGYKASQLRDMVGGGKALQQAKAFAETGRDPVSGDPIKTNEDTRTPEQVEMDRLELERKRQIVEAGRSPEATPSEKQRGLLEESFESGAISQAEYDAGLRAWKKKFLGIDPFDVEEGGDVVSAGAETPAEEGATPSTSSAPAVGTVQGGYEFTGGDPSDKNNWKKV